MAIPTYDNVTTDADSVGRASASFSHTVSGSNTCLIVFVHMFDINDPAPSVSGITYNSVALSKIRSVVQIFSSTRRNRTEAWRLVAPADGANTLAVTYSKTITADVVTAVSFNAVDQTTPIAGSAQDKNTGGNPSVDITTTQTNSLITTGLTVKGGDTDPFTMTDGTERWDTATGTNANTDIGVTGGDRNAASITTYTMAFTPKTTDNWTQIAVELSEIQAAPSGIASLRELVGHGQGTR